MAKSLVDYKTGGHKTLIKGAPKFKNLPISKIEKRKITYIRKDFVEPFSKLGIKVGKQVEI